MDQLEQESSTRELIQELRGLRTDIHSLRNSLNLIAISLKAQEKAFTELKREVAFK